MNKAIDKKENDNSKQQNAIRFIEAAQDLLDTEGLEAISIRKIASKAGFHNSTLYLYFEDLDYLILMASLKYFSEYSKSLAECSRKKLSPGENFFTIWEIFCRSTFSNPQIFYNFFFGKHSDNITFVMDQYYELFPERKEDYSDEIREMYYGNDFAERCRKILIPLIPMSDTRVSPENIEVINLIIVSCFKELLSLKCADESLDNIELTKQFMAMVTHTICV